MIQDRAVLCGSKLAVESVFCVPFVKGILTDKVGGYSFGETAPAINDRIAAYNDLQAAAGLPEFDPKAHGVGYYYAHGKQKTDYKVPTVPKKIHPDGSSSPWTPSSQASDDERMVNEMDQNIAEHKASINRVDIDHDGRVSREEWIQEYGTDKGFDEADFDHSGSLGVNEFAVHRAADTTLQDFRMAQLRFLLGQEFQNALVAATIEFLFLSIILTAIGGDSYPERSKYSVAEVGTELLNQ